MLNVVIPMAGLGTRFLDAGYDIPKPLIEIGGKTLVEHSIETLGVSADRYIFITREYDDKKYNDMLTNIFNNLVSNFVEIRVSGIQHGTSYSALYAKDFINNDDELILTNCDQRLEWDADAFLNYLRESKADGCILVHPSSSHKHSYAVVENGLVTHLAEKNPVSDNALVGVHYWKHGKDFVKSAEQLVEACLKDGRESYVSLTYNYLINDGKTVSAYPIPASQYIPLGTPRDLEIYDLKIHEYYTKKPMTVFLDLDGTILRHAYHFPDPADSKPELLPGALDKINSWIDAGHKIIITTARREINRGKVEEQLKNLGVRWDQMIMDLSSGTRVLINDKLQEIDEDRALGINVVTDSGFEDIDWEGYGL
jgi:dTDP-glucose pyrophosphorylase